MKLFHFVANFCRYVLLLLFAFFNPKRNSMHPSNDVSTDTDVPPQLRTSEGLKAMDGSTATVIKHAYPALCPLNVNCTVEQAYDTAFKTISHLSWQIVFQGTFHPFSHNQINAISGYRQATGSCSPTTFQSRSVHPIANILKFMSELLELLDLMIWVWLLVRFVYFSIRSNRCRKEMSNYTWKSSSSNTNVERSKYRHFLIKLTSAVNRMTIATT